MPKFKAVSLAQQSDQSLQLVAASGAVGTEPTMWHAWQAGPDGEWTGWKAFGKPGHGHPGPPAIIAHALSERLEVFVVTSGDQAVWHRWQTGSGPASWSGWKSLGQPGGWPAQGPVAVALLGDGRIMAIATAGGKVWQATSSHEPAAPWSAWSPLGLPGGAAALAVAAATGSDNLVELATLGEAGKTGDRPTGTGSDLWYSRQTGRGTDSWSGWESLDQPGGHQAGIPVFAADPSGRLELFTTAADGRVWHTGQQVKDDSTSWGPWGPWQALIRPGHRFGELAVTMDSAQGLILVATTAAGNHLWYALSDPATDTWYPMSPLAAVPGASPHDAAALASPALALNSDKGTELFVVVPETGNLYQLSAPAPGAPPTVGEPWPHP